MAILKLSTVADPEAGKPSHDLWINSDHIVRWYDLTRGPDLSEWTQLIMADGTSVGDALRTMVAEIEEPDMASQFEDAIKARL